LAGRQKMKPLSSLPEIQSLVDHSKSIRIPYQINVPVTDRILRLIDTEAFGRLRRISQLGLVSLVYPGAVHSRFEHSLGVYRNALLYLQQLTHNKEFSDFYSAHDGKKLLVAALFHDIGHWPYCHPIEDMCLKEIPNHEDLAFNILQSDQVAELLDRDWDLTPQEVAGILSKESQTAADRISCQVLSGPIDIDKMDYLYRDSLHAGVPYGNQIDSRRIISSLCLNENNDGIAITEKGRAAAELMVFARFAMFSEVYWHSAVRSATAMLQRCFYHIRDRFSLDQFWSLDDFQFQSLLVKFCEQTPAENLANHLFRSQRRLLKKIRQYSSIESEDVYRKVARKPYNKLVELSDQLIGELNQRLGLNLQPCELLIDAPPVGLEVQFKVPVKIGNPPQFRKLGEISPVISALATSQFDDQVKRVRVFVDPKWIGKIPLESLDSSLLDCAHLIDS